MGSSWPRSRDTVPLSYLKIFLTSKNDSYFKITKCKLALIRSCFCFYLFFYLNTPASITVHIQYNLLSAHLLALLTVYFVSVKGTVSRDFRPSFFFHQTIPPGPLIHGQKPFWIPFYITNAGGKPRIKPGVWRPEMWALIYPLEYCALTATICQWSPFRELPTLAILFFCELPQVCGPFFMALAVRSSTLPDMPQWGK
jgi:hypothetical protein